MKQKNYKLRSKVYKGIGTTFTFGTTIGGFLTYEAITDWSNFKTDMENFVVINTESVKLNIAIAFPMLIAMLVFIWVYRKKNAEELKGKVALPLFFGIIILWLIYSVIQAMLFAMIGAFVGSLIDETMFTSLSKKAKILAQDDHEIALEKRKEKVRRKVSEELDGTV